MTTPPSDDLQGAARRRLARDRRGRGRRGPLAWPPVPEMVSRADRFDSLVLDAMERVGPRAGGRLDGVEVAVELLPTGDVLAEAARDGQVPLGHVRPTQGRTPARIVVYRRPLESRARGLSELGDLVDVVVVEQAAALLMVAPEDLDPDYDPGDL